MKKLFSMLLVVTMLMSMVGVTSFAEGTVTIDGESIIYKIPHEGETAYVAYTASLDGEAAEFVYSLEGEPTGVSIDSTTGKLAVTSEAPATVTVKAALASDETVYATKDVTINDGWVVDFSSSDDTAMFEEWNWSNLQYGQITSEGYVAITEDVYTISGKIPVGASGTGNFTFEFDMLMSSTVYDGDWRFGFNLRGMSSNGSGTWETFRVTEYDSANSVVTLSALGGPLGKYPVDSWITIKVEVNAEEGYHDIYINDIYCQRKSHGSEICFLDTLRFRKVNFDNLTAYSGIQGQPQSSIQVVGANTVYKTPNAGETTYLGGYSATMNGVEAPITLALKENYTDVSFDAEDGTLAVGYNAPSSITLVAEYKNNTAIKTEKTIAITDAWVKNLNSNPSDLFWSSYTSSMYVSKSSSDYYVDPSLTSSNVGLKVGDSYGYNVAPSGTDAFTFEFDMGITEKGITNGTANWQRGVLFQSYGGTTWEAIGFANYDSENQTVDLTANSGAKLGTFNLGDWVSVKLAVNSSEGYHNVYVNNVLAATVQHTGSLVANINAVTFKVPFDNIKTYSGIAASKVSSDTNNIYIPADGKSANAHLSISGADGETVTWSLASEYTGVSVNSQTGVVTVTSEAAEGAVSVNATNASGMSLGSYALNLKKAEFDGTTATGFTEATVAAYDGETVLKANNNNIYYNFAKDQLKGRFVAEGSFLAESGSVAISSSMHGQGSWITWAPDYTTNEWIDFKAIFDTEAKTVTSILNGKIYNKADMDFIMNDASADVSISSLIMTCKYLKDFRVYTVGDNTVPEAYEAKTETVSIGTPLAASYTYVSEAGLPESCSVITWYKSYSESGVYESVGSSYTPTVADVGYYFKASIQPASDEIKGLAVETDAVQLEKPWEYTTEHINIVNGDEVTNKLVANGVISSVTVSKTFTADAATAYVALYEVSETPELKAISSAVISGDMSVGFSAELELTEKITLPADVTNYVAKVIIVNNELTPLAKPYECDDSQKQLIVMGDSIFHDYHLDADDTMAITGVGEVIGDYLTDNVTVVNRAYSGHTTEKYLNYTTFEETGYDEMFTWAQIKPLINEGDMIIVTLGINDEGKAIPYNEYMANLGTFVTEGRALGAEVVIGTPTLTQWSDTEITKTYGERAEKAVEAAITYGAPYVDINTAAYEDYVEIGDVETIRKSYYLYPEILEDNPQYTSVGGSYSEKGFDYCHLSEGGARYYAKLIASLLNSTDSCLANYIKVN